MYAYIEENKVVAQMLLNNITDEQITFKKQIIEKILIWNSSKSMFFTSILFAQT